MKRLPTLYRLIPTSSRMMPQGLRRHHLSPIEALEDWDMLKPEDYELF